MKFLAALSILIIALTLEAGDKTHLYLVRNGATPRNVSGFVQGQEEVPDAQLNQEGKEQAERTGKRLAAKHPELSHKFYSSPLGRAWETAKIASAYFMDARIVKNEDLKEISHGNHDGMEKSLRNKFYNQYYEREMVKFQTEFPGQEMDPYIKWKSNPLAGAETCQSMCERSLKALTQIGEENLGESVAVFTHGALIEALITHLHHLQGVSQNKVLPLWYEEACMPNCAIAHFVYRPHAEKEDDVLTFDSFE
jgi:broad specificity phosphatase PhoE